MRGRTTGGMSGSVTRRTRLGWRRAAVADPALLVDELAGVSRAVAGACEREPAGRLVLTRHGDAILLSDFLVTRVFEVAVHGLDVADAVRSTPWLTPAGALVVHGLLFDEPPGPEPVAAIREATGRGSAAARGRLVLG